MTTTTSALTTRPHQAASSDRRITEQRTDATAASDSARRLIVAGVLTPRHTSAQESVALAELVQRTFLGGRQTAARAIEDLAAATRAEWEDLDDLDKPGDVERDWYLDGIEDARKAAAGEPVL